MKGQEFLEWSCGAAAIKNALECYGIEISEADARRMSGTKPVTGTQEEGIIGALRYYGFSPEEKFFKDSKRAWNWLHTTLQSGSPVILCTEDWEHWVLAIGSLGKTGVAIFDSWHAQTKMWDFDDLMEEWVNTDREEDDETPRIYAISVSKKIPFRY